jgi:salicylate hydroxylase
MVHRADLQAALIEAAQAEPNIELRLGARADNFADDAHGLTVQVARGSQMQEERGAALVGADGLWSKLRARLGDGSAPQFSGRAAWRTTLPADKAPREFREPVIHLWLGRNAHLVHYPVRGGTLVNMVAIAPDRMAGKSWSDDGMRDEVLSRFPIESWAPRPREFLARAQHWLNWTLYDRPASWLEGRGPMTLLGDAAHPMLPFLAQGGAMAIEDAAVLARCIQQSPNALSDAMRRYEAQRFPRTARVQRAARRTVKIYHQSGPAALARNLAMTAIGGERLRRRYDWIYDWRSV